MTDRSVPVSGTATWIKMFPKTIPANVRLGTHRHEFADVFCSADLQSAVSQNCILRDSCIYQPARNYREACRLQIGDTADCKSALRQRICPIELLRYLLGPGTGAVRKKDANGLDLNRISVKNYKNQQSHLANSHEEAGGDDGLFRPAAGRIFANVGRAVV
jgi:hypothetical protein